MKTFKEYRLDRKLDKYVSDEIKKRNELQKKKQGKLQRLQNVQKKRRNEKQGKSQNVPHKN